MGVFHAGETEVQARAGVANRAAKVGNGIHSVLPDAAKVFLNERTFAVIGAADRQGDVWASLVTGQPGFLDAADDTCVDVYAALAWGDPLADAFETATSEQPLAVGMLAIDTATRRRMRLNGDLHRIVPGIYSLHAREVYANCPKYIQKRHVATPIPSTPRTGTVTTGTDLNAEQIAQIRAADTFFIATKHVESGADASHRGGLPGFVHVSENGGTILFPDYSGNAMFNTLGNIRADSHAGLLFPDWESGAVLQVTGDAEIIWDGEEVTRFAGAERAVRLHIRKAVAQSGVLPSSFTLQEYSPFNPA